MYLSFCRHAVVLPPDLHSSHWRSITVHVMILANIPHEPCDQDITFMLPKQSRQSSFSKNIDIHFTHTNTSQVWSWIMNIYFASFCICQMSSCAVEWMLNEEKASCRLEVAIMINADRCCNILLNYISEVNRIITSHALPILNSVWDIWWYPATAQACAFSFQSVLKEIRSFNIYFRVTSNVNLFNTPNYLQMEFSRAKSISTHAPAYIITCPITDCCFSYFLHWISIINWSESPAHPYSLLSLLLCHVLCWECLIALKLA